MRCAGVVAARLPDLGAGGVGHGRRPATAGTPEPGNCTGDRETGSGAGAERDKAPTPCVETERKRHDLMRLKSPGAGLILDAHPGGLLPAVRQPTTGGKLYPGGSERVHTSVASPVPDAYLYFSPSVPESNPATAPMGMIAVTPTTSISPNSGRYTSNSAMSPFARGQQSHHY